LDIPEEVLENEPWAEIIPPIMRQKLAQAETPAD
jgi:hypothetical protein